MKTGPLRGLIIDDDEDHTLILRQAALSNPQTLQLTAVNNGDEALRYLQRDGVRPPDLILLDLHLPGRDGFEVLLEIRKSPALRTIPVLVLSSSASVLNVARAYACGANIVFAKPLAFERYRELVELIVKLWARFAELPSGTCA